MAYKTLLVRVACVQTLGSGLNVNANAHTSKRAVIIAYAFVGAPFRFHSVRSSFTPSFNKGGVYRRVVQYIGNMEL